MPIRVLLVDDHPLLRSGLQKNLEEQPDLKVVGEASSGGAALKLTKELSPDLIILDMLLPDMSGIEVARQIVSGTAPKIIIFSSDGDRSVVDEALEAGVCGYIFKDSGASELIQGIRMVLAGKLYLSPVISAEILGDYRNTLQHKTDDHVEPAKPVLAEREKELLRLIADGLRNKEIGVALSVSTKSVEAYRSRLMKKLDCSSSAQLVRYAIREGIARV